MEEIFPKCHVIIRIFVQTSSKRKPVHRIFYFNLSNEKIKSFNEIKCEKRAGHDNLSRKVIDTIKCCDTNIFLDINKKIAEVLPFAIVTRLLIDNISMLKRSRSMELDDSDEYKSPNLHSSIEESPKEDEELAPQSSKKICNSFNYEEGKSSTESDDSPESNRNSAQGRSESHRRYSQSGENIHVTQSKSIFSHKDSFVYGNPKDEIKNIENPLISERTTETSFFESNSTNALDLSCKAGKMEEEKPDERSTYHNYQRGSSVNETAALRSNVEVKPVGQGSQKKPSLPEQLQIAKIQQQQRRSMQQQQKFLQQMRKSLDPKSSSSSSSSVSSNRQETSQSGIKNAKLYGNNGTNHESNDIDSHQRSKDEFYPRLPGAHFPQMPYPYFDPNHPKELPDNHPILPLLDPVYFSALYNAHGFLPPSSPSIAAAFIGTLQDALPKLPMMFPSTSSNNSPLLPQKSNENPN